MIGTIKGRFTEIKGPNRIFALRNEPGRNSRQKISPTILKGSVPKRIAQGGDQKSEHPDSVDAHPDVQHNEDGQHLGSGERIAGNCFFQQHIAQHQYK